MYSCTAVSRDTFHELAELRRTRKIWTLSHLENLAVLNEGGIILIEYLVTLVYTPAGINLHAAQM